MEDRSPEIRKDCVMNRWVIVSPGRARRPSDFKSKTPNPAPPPDKGCPFCVGHEHECAPEIFRLLPPDSNSPWTIRVIENLYPALARNLDPPLSFSRSDGLAQIRGFGFHDVVIETPLHSLQLCDLKPEEIGDVFFAYKRRIEQLLLYPSLAYVQVFKNHGASAGASMSHSHSQIIALPIVPSLVLARIASMKEYFEQSGKCCICEIRNRNLFIDESAHFISIVPHAACFPFEIWIIPRDHSSHFHEIDLTKAVDLGGLLKLILQKISVQLNNPPFNFMIQSSPLKISGSKLSYAHWFLQIVPQLNAIAGFEIGTGCHINPVFPEDAAKILREVRIPVEG